MVVVYWFVAQGMLWWFYIHVGCMFQIKYFTKVFFPSFMLFLDWRYSLSILIFTIIFLDAGALTFFSQYRRVPSYCLYLQNFVHIQPFHRYILYDLSCHFTFLSNDLYSSNNNLFRCSLRSRLLHIWAFMSSFFVSYLRLYLRSIPLSLLPCTQVYFSLYFSKFVLIVFV
jgi:hypothetical protein